ncbi:MAG TPA: cytochrome c [Bryobacteraceae bacterium]|nr:cytochrome c [Bryobacteraceae bacterium]
MKTSILLLVAAAAFAQTPNAENGRKLFARYGCYQCHQREAQGAAATGPRLGPHPIPYANFTKYVRHPAGQMPPYTEKVVKDSELADIYAFLQSLPNPPAVKDVPLLSQ